MTKVQLVRRAAWTCLAVSVAAFAAGIALARFYLCQSPGPTAFAIALVLCILAALLFVGRSIQVCSFWPVGGALLVGLLAVAMWVIAVAMTLPGCSGV